MNKINKLFSEYAQYKRIIDDAQRHADDIKKKIIEEMDAQHVDTLNGLEHKAVYKTVVSNRIDTKALKKEHTDIYNMYVVSCSSKRFIFN